MNEYEKILSFFAGAYIGLIIFAVILALGATTIYIVGRWKLFKKAGKQGWEAIIPFYSTYTLIEISELNWWYFLIAISGTIISILDIDELSAITTIASRLVNVFCFYNIAKKTKQNPTSYAITAAFVPGIMALIVGLSKSITWDKTITVSPNGPINSSKEKNNTEQEKYCLNCGQKLDYNVKYCKNCGKKVE